MSDRTYPAWVEVSDLERKMMLERYGRRVVSGSGWPEFRRFMRDLQAERCEKKGGGR